MNQNKRHSQPNTLTAEQKSERFPHTLLLTEIELYWGQREQKEYEPFLSIRVPDPHDRGKSDPYSFWTDRQTLVDFAKRILREIDPTPEDQILESLQRIEGLLERQGS